MKLIKKIITISIITIMLSACCGADIAINNANSFIKKQNIDKTNPRWKTQLPKPPELSFSDNMDYFWDLQTTQGNLTIKLFNDSAPMHVSSTIYLTMLGFYDNLTFHRVIPRFMAQGGDPVGNGTGNPGYKYEGEYAEGVSHSEAGTLSMANAGPGTDGSQFFLTFKATPFLDGKHTVFGKIVNDSAEVLSKIEALGTRSGRTKETVKIIKASIRTNQR